MLTKNADFDKNKCSGYCIGFESCGSFSLSDGSGFGKNVIIFGAEFIVENKIIEKKIF